MAEALLADWLRRNHPPGDWRIGSAGVWAAAGLPATEYARQALAARGLDLTRHRSRLVNAQLLAQADLVLCMTRSHREALQVEFPQYAGRVRLLSEMIGQEFDVDDPYGGPLEGYVETANELAEWIERGGKKIVEWARGSDE